VRGPRRRGGDPARLSPGLLPQRAEDIPAGKVAPALLLAALSAGVGLINAACMEYGAARPP